MKHTIVILLLLIKTSLFYSQTIIAPNYALKSHETLFVNKIDVSREKTVVHLTIENRITGGQFCADKNIFIINPDGTRSKLTASAGIPVCPDAHNFKAIGEKLDFILTFPPLKTGTDCIDLIEECNNNCFSFYGIILENEVNKLIDGAIMSAENGEPVKALVALIKLAEISDNKDPGIKGLLYINIIKLSRETGNSVKASEWYKKLTLSKMPEAFRYIEFLNNQGIKY